MKRALVFVTILLMLSVSGLAQSVTPAPSLINFQGHLAKPDGTSLADGTYSVTFSLWNIASGGSVMTNQLWNETDTIMVRNGSFAVLLGNTAAFGNNVFNGNSWLQLQVGADAPLTPRQQIVSVAFALKANTVPDGSITNVKISSGLDFNKLINVPSTLLSLPYDGTASADTAFHITNNAGNAIVGLSTSGSTGIYGASLTGAGVIGVSNTSVGVQGLTYGAATYGGYFENYGGGIALKAVGKAQVGVLQITGGSDVAEPYRVAAAGKVKPLPGMLVSIDPEHVGQMRVASKAYDRAVGGILSGANGIRPGMTLQQEGTVADGTLPVASVGRVWCWCDADANGAITPGDLLTSSRTPGHAMRVTDFNRANGSVIGKAMSSLKHGRGLVLVLVSLK